MKIDMNTEKGTIPYTLHHEIYLPDSYQKLQKKYPLILFLHGMNERGDTVEYLRKIRSKGVLPYMEQHPNFPFIVIAPLCPSHTMWPMMMEPLFSLLQQCINDYRVDTSRIYVTGLSMGGYGTWHFATLYPEHVATAIPICGGGVPASAERLKNIPIWVFHGDQDKVVLIEESQMMVDALKKEKGTVMFTIYEGVGHDAWTKTYQNDAIYTWLLKQRKNSGSQ